MVTDDLFLKHGFTLSGDVPYTPQTARRLQPHYRFRFLVPTGKKKKRTPGKFEGLGKKSTEIVSPASPYSADFIRCNHAIG